MGISSCLGGLRSLLNTEGILTLPMFLLSNGSLIRMWSASFAQWWRVLLSLSIIVKSLSSAFGCFVEQHSTPLSKRSTSHSYQRSITQQKHWQNQNPFSIQQTSQTSQTTRNSHSSIPPPKGAPSLLGLSTQKTINTSHLLDLCLQ